MEPIIEMNGVSKSFKDKKAVNQLSFQIPQGSITAILGPNGAGKTTAISMLLGLLEPTEGRVKLFGQAPKERTVREKTGAMLQDISVLDRLKVREVLELVRSYYPTPLELTELGQLAGIAPVDLNRYADKLSGGQKRSLGFALALAGNPELIFLDEPTVGLDIKARRQFWHNVRQLSKQGKTILFTTHYLQEADDIADRILLFSRGSLIADGTPEEIKARIVKRSISFIAEEDGPALRARLLELAPVIDCYDRDGRIHLTTNDTDEALAALFTSGLPRVKNVQIEQGRLEEAFEQLTNPQEAEMM